MIILITAKKKQISGPGRRSHTELWRDFTNRGNEYPEYRLFEAYLAYLEDNQALAKEILKNYQSKEFTRDELEEAGVFLYLCTLVGLYRDKGQAVQKLQNFFRQKSDSFQLLWILLQLDPTYQKSPSMAPFMMEELYEKGCTSPILYLEAWNWISKDISNLHRLSLLDAGVPLCRKERFPHGRTGDAPCLSFRL